MWGKLLKMAWKGIQGNSSNGGNVLLMLGGGILFVIILVPIIIIMFVVTVFSIFFQNQVPIPTMYHQVIVEKAPCTMDTMGIVKLYNLENSLFTVPSNISSSHYVDKNGKVATRGYSSSELKYQEEFLERLKKYYIQAVKFDQVIQSSGNEINNHTLVNQVLDVGAYKQESYCIMKPLDTIYENMVNDKVITLEESKRSKEYMAYLQMLAFDYPLREDYVITSYSPSYKYEPFNPIKEDVLGFEMVYLDKQTRASDMTVNDARHVAFDIAPLHSEKYGSDNVPVYSMIDGTVIYVRNHMVDHDGNVPQSVIDDPNLWCGNSVEIEGKYPETEEKLKITYCHLQLNSVNVKEGDEVKKGQQVAKVGNTGYSTGTHLHLQFEGDTFTHYTNLTNQHLLSPNHFLEFHGQNDYIQLAKDYVKRKDALDKSPNKNKDSEEDKKSEENQEVPQETH